MRLHPYLHFNGQCEEAFKFYEQCLGGQIVAMMRHEGSPMEEHVPAEWAQKIMHACMMVDGEVLAGSDCPPGYYSEPKGSSVTLALSDPAAADRIFHAFAEGGTVQMPIQETFWAARFGMVTDRFGTPWMINCEPAAA